MQGEVAWCEYKQRWLRGSATFHLPSTTGAVPRNTANGAGGGPPGRGVPASHFRTAHCPRRTTSCYTRWWLTNGTKAYRIPFGKALVLEDHPSISYCTLLALLRLTNLSTLCLFLKFLLCIPFFYLSSYFFWNGKMMGFASTGRGNAHILWQFHCRKIFPETQFAVCEPNT